MSHKGAIAALSLSVLLASLGSSVANAALPTLARSLGASFQSAQWVVLAYLLAVTTLVVSIGKLADILGRRRLLMVGIGLFVAASLGCAAAPSLVFLIAARAVQGIGGAVMMALPLAMAGQLRSDGKIGAAMGILGAASAVGTALGPSLGGLLTAAVGWRSIFLVAVPLGLVAIALATRSLPVESESRNAKGGFDLWGTLLLGISLGAYSLSMTIGRGHLGLMNLGLLLTAVATAGLFVYFQARSTSPLVPLGLLRHRPIRVGLTTSLFVSAVLMSTLVVGPFYLTGALKQDAARVGMILAVGPVVVALTGVPAGRLADRIGASSLTMWGLVLIGSGCVLIAVVPLLAGLIGYVVPVLLITVGYSGFQTANNALVMAEAEPAQRGVLSGLLNLSRNLGLVTGAALLGAVFSAVSRSSGIAVADAAHLSQGLRATFALGFLFIGIAFVFTVYREITDRDWVRERVGSSIGERPVIKRWNA